MIIPKSARLTENWIRMQIAIISEFWGGPYMYVNKRGAVVPQWIRPQTLSREVPSSNLLAAAVVPSGKALYPHCLVLWKDVCPLVACLL